MPTFSGTVYNMQGRSSCSVPPRDKSKMGWKLPVDSALERKVAVACVRPQTDLGDGILSEMNSVSRTNTWAVGSLEIESSNVGPWEGMRISV